jgi:hypothetical protein
MDTVKVTVESRAINSRQLPLIRCMIPGYGQYSIPLNLTKEQGAMLEEGRTEYEAVLVKGRLKDGKDGAYPDNFWWNVAMFEGVADEVAMSRAKNNPEPEVSTPVYANTPVYTDTPVSTFSSVNTKTTEIRWGVCLKIAGPQVSVLMPKASVPDTYIATIDLATLYMSTYSEESLLNVMDLPEVEPEVEPKYGYPKPPSRINSKVFEQYVESAGWSWDDIAKWLGGLDPVDWIAQEEGRTMRDALKICRDQAVEADLEPPADFREEID